MLMDGMGKEGRGHLMLRIIHGEGGWKRHGRYICGLGIHCTQCVDTPHTAPVQNLTWGQMFGEPERDINRWRITRSRHVYNGILWFSEGKWNMAVMKQWKETGLCVPVCAARLLNCSEMEKTSMSLYYMPLFMVSICIHGIWQMPLQKWFLYQ